MIWHSSIILNAMYKAAGLITAPKPFNVILVLLGAAQIIWLPTVSMVLIFWLLFGLLLLIVVGLRYKPMLQAAYFIFGLCYALMYCQYQMNQQLKQPTQASLSVSIASLPKYSATKVSFIAQDTVDEKRYLLSLYLQTGHQLAKLELDQVYQIEVNLKPPHGTANGVGFDREKWLFRHGIDGIGTIKNWQPNDTKQHSINTYINQWRASLSALINQHFTDPRVNALIHALSIGDKSHFDQGDIQVFQNTGTAHLIAISGLHIGMVALLGWFVGALLFKVWPRQNLPKPLIQVFIGLVFALFYASLAGLAVSTQRAVIMLLVLGCYQLMRRSTYAWDVWSTSLLLVLIIDPLNVLDSGFWLSFMAVAVLILAFNGQGNSQHKIIAFIKMQFALLIGMLPLSLAVFSRLTLIAPMVNLLMIPLMTFALIPALLVLLLFGSLFQVFPDTWVALIQLISQLFIGLLDGFNQFSSLALSTAITFWWQYMLLIIGAVWLILPSPVPQRYWGLAMILLGLYAPLAKPPKGHFKASFIDVGQGLSVLVETQNKQLIYDVGAAYDSGFNMVDAVVLPFLQQQQINQLDALILSHQDNDHSGAAKQLMQQIQIDTVWGTEPSHQACLAGHTWIWDDVKFSFLSPNNLIPYLKNNSSCVLKIEALTGSLLLTGDIEKPVEYRLQTLPADLISADVLLIPHHGSKTSSSSDFIKAVNPSMAINSSGQYNPFNHPAPEIKQRYKAHNIKIIDTQQSGLITLSTFPELQIQQFRVNHPRIWHKKKPE